MKHATSIRLLGELIPADLCNYKSFSSLCLICPHCKKSVYLVGEHERCSTTRQLQSGKIVSVKESRVSPHFAHHINDENLIVCDKKDSEITPQILDHKRTVARNQRARLFRASFWQLYCSNQYFANFFQALSQSQFDEYVKDAHAHTHLVFYSPLANETIPIETGSKDFAIDKTEKDILFRDINRRQEIRLVAEFTWHRSGKTSGFEEQYKFVSEALAFLYAPPNKKLLRKCLTGLVISVYSTHFFQATNMFSSAFLSGTLDPGVKRQIIEKTEIASANLLEEKNPNITDGVRTIDLSILSMSLIVSLLSINLEVELKKYGF